MHSGNYTYMFVYLKLNMPDTIIQLDIYFNAQIFRVFNQYGKLTTSFPKWGHIQQDILINEIALFY